MRRVDRREWLELAGATVTMAGLAGCTDEDTAGTDSPDGNTPGTDTDTGAPAPETGTDTDTETPEDEDDEGEGSDGDLGGDLDVPAYGSWLRAPGDAPAEDPYSYVAVDVAVFDWGDESGTATPTPTPTPTSTPDGPDDPLVQNPAVSLLSVAFLVGFGLGDVGLSGLVNTGTDENAADSPADSITLTQDGIVLSGSFDVEAVAGDVEDAGLTEVDTVGEYTLYYDGDDSAVAVGSQHVLTATDDSEGGSADPREALRRAIDTNAGGRERYHEASADFEWLLRTAGHGDIVVGRATENAKMDPSQSDDGDGNFQTNDDLYRGAKGVVHHLSRDPRTETLDAKAALVYDSADLVDTDRLKSFAGTAADERDVVTDGRKVVVEATYRS